MPLNSKLSLNLPSNPAAAHRGGKLLPKPLLTTDQVEMLKTDNVVSADAVKERRTLAGLGISPDGIEAQVPSYLYRFRKAGQFTAVSGTTPE